MHLYIYIHIHIYTYVRLHMFVCMYVMQRGVYVIAYRCVCIRLNADACDLWLQSACAYLDVYMNHYTCMQLHADLCNHIHPCVQMCIFV